MFGSCDSTVCVTHEYRLTWRASFFVAAHFFFTCTMAEQQRRMFRGRGGPNDRRLPKYNARRRRRPKEERPPKYADDVVREDEEGMVEGEEELDATSDVEEELEHDEPAGNEPHEPSFIEATSPVDQELRHLKLRIERNRQAWQTSKSLANPLAYQTNVLHSLRNIFGEYRSILRRYDPEEAPSLLVFECLQHGLQCGPLAGSKPGYFARCGSEIASQVARLLEDLVPTRKVALDEWRFTEKQADAILKWKAKATETAAKNQPPSKAVTKKQQTKKR